MHKILSIIFSLITFHAIAQDSATTYVQQHAIKLERLDKLNEKAYQLLSPYRIIMVGEMHGTNEAAIFAKGVTQLFSEHNDSVLLGLEIPNKLMKKYLTYQTVASIYQSNFFAEPDYLSGRECYAWADLVAAFHQNKKVKIFFFDCDTSFNANNDRDFLMYNNIKKEILIHPNYKTITISGNIHNQILTDRITMGKFLANDSVLNLKNKICSLNEYYIRGSMMNNSGNGLQKKEIDYGENVISKAIDSDYFLMLANPKKNYQWTGIFFARTITAAKMVKE